VIACLLLTDAADTIFSAHSDFVAYIGEKCLCMKSFCLSKDGKLDNIVLSTGDKSMANEVINCLHVAFPRTATFFVNQSIHCFVENLIPCFGHSLVLHWVVMLTPGVSKALAQKCYTRP